MLHWCYNFSQLIQIDHSILSIGNTISVSKVLCVFMNQTFKTILQQNFHKGRKAETKPDTILIRLSVEQNHKM